MRDRKTTQPMRCGWVNIDNPLSVSYHDNEWGKPVRDDCTLFEFMVLESAQAGLSWETILKKREAYRKAFYDFDVARVARMTEKDVARLMENPGIIRNERKIRSAISNARAFEQVQKEYGSFARYLWSWVTDKPIQNNYTRSSDVPTTTPLAITMSTDLKARGFTFLGPTIWYAYMQAVGMVNDHTLECFRHKEITRTYKRT